ncbi:predicted protein [Uncinocarpus reesii 1704]|uniref:DUF3074 domain-containing protein n=1 Tax=Uncinocarpus reesii (strain UAMH 1704) TaxID=336963 RepID=C4K025_UNCRE|nr:uncharacterized protein UREG_07776 [Uncinocarpus reesii 1704]EEP82911.1 predicted protein [Uncinocarpus reesii 1704]
MNIADLVSRAPGANRSRASSKSHPRDSNISRDTSPICHPQPLSLIDIPWHHSHSVSTGRRHHHPDLDLFIKYALDQGREWITMRMPWHQEGSRTAPSRPARARVQVCSYAARYRPYKETPENRGPCTDYWFGRRSVHEDVAKTGCASLGELRDLLKDDHAENEMRYNSDVVNVERVSTYDLSKVAVGGGWSDVTACVNLITHKYPMCTTRCYTILEITAALPPAATPKASQISPSFNPQDTTNPQTTTSGTPARPGFIIIQLPLQHSELPEAKQTKTTNCIFANYISIEMVRRLDGVHKRRIEWTMATAAHAGGWIPASLQRSWRLGGVPKQIVKDVGFVMAYLATQRRAR